MGDFIKNISELRVIVCNDMIMLRIVVCQGMILLGVNGYGVYFTLVCLGDSVLGEIIMYPRLEMLEGCFFKDHRG